MERFIKKFEKGTTYVDIVSAVTKNELTDIEVTQHDYMDLDCVKFIPASGAATRMFQDLYAFLDGETSSEKLDEFFVNLEKFAFYSHLEEVIGRDVIDKVSDEGRRVIVHELINDGLGYGSLPKALLKFYDYGGHVTTPIDEHIYEAENYLGDKNIKLEFTISKEHEAMFKDYVEHATKDKEHVSIGYSFQKQETDTLAVDMDNNPFKLECGEVLYRAGGHGALIENLNDIDADVVFIKNIDNVCHKDMAKDTIDSKRKLASIGYEIKRQIDCFIGELENDTYKLEIIKVFLEDVLNITYKGDLTKEVAMSFLNRPLRVSGMVKNEGEPGGGPYIVDNGDYTDMQILEKVEIDIDDPRSREIMETSGYFNPVDLVCFIKDHKGQKFNLIEYINQDRYFISEKSHKGRALKAFEHPGLWNGAMHYWNTVFVEVPLSTFNPVKVVGDLLR